MDAWALCDTFRSAAIALAAAEEEPETAASAFFEAVYWAPGAFPPGPLADALNIVLGAVGDMATGVTA